MTAGGTPRSGTGEPGEGAASSLLVDLYELTMAAAYVREGMAEAPATFSLFVRKLPDRRGCLVAAGLDDALRWLQDLSFGEAELAVLERVGGFDDAFLGWLAGVRFTGRVRAVPEGTVVLADEPLLEVEAPLAVGQLAETFLLNQLSLQTTLATKAARCRHAAGGRGVVDFGLRRAQGVDAGMKLARVAGLVGLAGTSNVLGADRYGLAANGTMAHAYVQAHEDELRAFRSFAETFGRDAVLLVDTYDPEQGIEHAVEVARSHRVRGIRLDSGDLATLARTARHRLDQAGLGDVAVFASGGLDEHRIRRLVQAGAPIDAFGVGTALSVAEDAPSLEIVYKLVVHDGRPVRKTSPGKQSWPGAKQVWRPEDWSGDLLSTAAEPAPEGSSRPLLAEVLLDGERVGPGRWSLEQARAHFEAEWASLPSSVSDLEHPTPPPVTASDELRRIARILDAAGE